MQLTQKSINNNSLLLDIHNLNVFFNTPEGLSHVVRDANFNIKKGTCLGVVGESGSGKTQTFFSITGLLANNGYVKGYYIYIRDEKIIQLLNLFIGNIQRIDKLVYIAKTYK